MVSKVEGMDGLLVGRLNQYYVLQSMFVTIFLPIRITFPTIA